MVRRAAAHCPGPFYNETVIPVSSKHMNRIKHILVCVDFSDGARAALEQALRISAQNQAALHVIHVIDAAALDELAAALHTPLAQQKANAIELGRAELVRWLEPCHPPEHCLTEVVVGAPLDTLLTRAREFSTDLIVAGAQGDNTSSPQAGPLAVQLLRQSPAKVLLVDASHAAPFQTVVACVDFAPSACEVIAQAKRLAALGASQVEFLHVYDPPWHRLRHVMPALSASPDLRDQYLNMLECQLRDLVGIVSDVTARRVLHESPRHRSGIAAFAQQQNADLIVLATGRRTHSEADLLGSTAERLVRELPCSVLVVKPSPDGPGITAATAQAT